MKSASIRFLPHAIKGCYHLRNNQKRELHNQPEKLSLCVPMQNNYYESLIEEPEQTADRRIAISKGTINNKSREKITSSINCMRQISPMKSVYSAPEKLWFKFRLNFITLTLPIAQFHDDNTITRQCLRPFLDFMKYNAKMNSYVWKAESQSNGNIHYHITTNVYIHYKLVQDAWNHNINKLNYVTNYKKVNGADDPHSTEIKSIRTDYKIASYVAGELCARKKYKKKDYKRWGMGEHFYEKENNIIEIGADKKYHEIKRPIHCRLWDCSYNLKNVELKYTLKDKGIEPVIDSLNPKLFWKIYSNDFGYCAYLKFNAWKSYPPVLRSEWRLRLATAGQNEPKTKSYNAWLS